MITILTMVGSAVLFIVIALTGLYYRSKKLDNNLKTFYNAVSMSRQYIHNAVTKEELQELHDDLVHLKESFDGLIPEVILNKETDLLFNLLNKKIKKNDNKK